MPKKLSSYEKYQRIMRHRYGRGPWLEKPLSWMVWKGLSPKRKRELTEEVERRGDAPDEPA